MSLLCAYSDSSSSSGSDNEEDETQHQTVAASTHLPSVDDLFASNGSSVLSGPTASRVATGFKAAQSQDVNKRRSDATELRTADAKRVKATTNKTTAPTVSSKPLAKPFAPPQLKRPNVSTEDTGAWNTQTTMKHQERKQKSSE